MADLRLAKLADRIPVKLTISVSPELNRALNDYAELYRETYGEAEPLHELVPAILSSFIASDRAFARRRAKASS